MIFLTHIIWKTRKYMRWAPPPEKQKLHQNPESQKKKKNFYFLFLSSLSLSLDPLHLQAKALGFIWAPNSPEILSNLSSFLGKPSSLVFPLFFYLFSCVRFIYTFFFLSSVTLFDCFLMRFSLWGPFSGFFFSVGFSEFVFLYQTFRFPYVVSLGSLQFQFVIFRFLTLIFLFVFTHLKSLTLLDLTFEIVCSFFFIKKNKKINWVKSNLHLMFFVSQ